MNDQTTGYTSEHQAVSELLDLGQYEQALVELERICERDPRDGEAFELRGLLAARMGRVNLTIHYLEKAHQLSQLEPRSLPMWR